MLIHSYSFNPSELRYSQGISMSDSCHFTCKSLCIKQCFEKITKTCFVFVYNPLSSPHTVEFTWHVPFYGKYVTTYSLCIFPFSFQCCQLGVKNYNVGCRLTESRLLSKWISKSKVVDNSGLVSVQPVEINCWDKKLQKKLLWIMKMEVLQTGLFIVLIAVFQGKKVSKVS